MRTSAKSILQAIGALVILCGIFTNARAQQHAQYTQYMYNTAIINPGYAASVDRATASGLYRAQWLGLDGAPTTINLTLTVPVGERWGIGFSALNDEIGNGTNQETQLDAMLAYSLPVSFEGRLSFGLMVQGSLLNVNSSKLRHYDPTLTPEEAQIDNKFTPNLGVGLYYYQWKGYVGLSAPILLETEHFNTSGSKDNYVFKERMYLNFIAGYVFDLNPDLKFKPAVLVQGGKGSPVTANISANFLFNDRFRLGAAYRWDTAISGLFGLQVTPDLLLGLAYDKDTTTLGNTSFNDGSFEVFLRFKFGFGPEDIISPRFF